MRPCPQCSSGPPPRTPSSVSPMPQSLDTIQGRPQRMIIEKEEHDGISRATCNRGDAAMNAAFKMHRMKTRECCGARHRQGNVGIRGCITALRCQQWKMAASQLQGLGLPAWLFFGRLQMPVDGMGLFFYVGLTRRGAWVYVVDLICCWALQILREPPY